MDCLQCTGSDRFPSCKSILEDSPCQLYTQVLLFQQLKLGKHALHKGCFSLTNVNIVLPSKQAA